MWNGGWNEQGEEVPFRILIDMESMSLLAMHRPYHIQENVYSQNPLGIPYFGIRWMEDFQTVEQADFLPEPELWQAAGKRSVYKQRIYRQEEDTEEPVCVVEQEDFDGSSFFLVIPPKE